MPETETDMLSGAVLLGIGVGLAETGADVTGTTDGETDSCAHDGIRLMSKLKTTPAAVTGNRMIFLSNLMETIIPPQA